ncbi:MAG: MBL fold metallo-hydrolase [Chthoniobacterales bacterium]
MDSLTSPEHGHRSSVLFWGVRGSIPTPGPGTVRYGGNTTCLELRLGGEIIILDAGSGLRPLGQALGREFGETPISLTILSTHTHWDHIQGFPFFAPAYGPQNHIHIIGRKPQNSTLEAMLSQQMDGRHFFPIPLADLPASISFQDLDPAGPMLFTVGSVAIRACPTNHPGGCFAYRFSADSGDFVFLTDHETGGKDEATILRFIAGAALLVADAQYTAEEADARHGWGHGCVDSIVDLALGAGIRRLVLFHHDPLHDDTFIDRMLERARSLVPTTSSLDILAAKEGQRIDF